MWTRTRSIALMCATTMLSTAAAQTRPAAGPGTTPFTVFQTPLAVQPNASGKLELDQRDTSQLLVDVLNRIGKVQDSDKEYLDKVIENLRVAVNEYTEMLVKGSFKKLSNVSANGNSIAYADFLAELDNIRGAQLKIQNNMSLLTSAAKALPSDAQINDGRNVHQLPAPRNIDFSKVIEAVKNAVANAEALANQFRFVVRNEEGLFITLPSEKNGTALNPAFDFPLLNEKEIRARTADARKLGTTSDLFEESAENHARALKKMISDFVYKFGETEKYRPEILTGDKNFREARAQAFEQIVNAFWQRDYLRKVYGVRVGAILPLEYQKRWAGLDRFTALNSMLKQFKEESAPSAISDADLMTAIEDYRQSLITLDQRTAAILSGDASILARINSFITMMKGETPTAEALLMVVQLLAADLKSEQTLATGLGLQEILLSFDVRWRTTDADKAAHDKRVCAFDTYAENTSPNCYQGSMDGGLKSVFTTMNDELFAQSTSLEKANQIRASLRAAAIAQSRMNGTAGQVKSRRG